MPRSKSTFSNRSYVPPDVEKRDRPTVICLGGGSEGLPIIQQIAKTYNVIVVDLDDYAPAIIWIKEFSQWGSYIKSDCYNYEAVVKHLSFHLSRAGQPVRLAGAICCAIDAPDVQARLAKYYNLPSIGTVAAELGRDKWEQYQALSSANLPVPPSTILNVHSTWESTSASDYDLLKPQVGRGSRGVLRYNQDTFRKCLISAIGESASGYKNVIAQKWIKGQQLSTESVIRNGKAVFTAVALRNYSKLEEFYPRIIEDGSDTPFHLKPAHYDALNNLLERACLALHWDNLTVKGDIIFDVDTFYIIELAPRLSGGHFCSKIIPMAYQYDLIHEALFFAVGKTSRENKSGETRYVCQRFLFPQEAWIGKKIKRVLTQKDLPETTPKDAFFSFHKSIFFPVKPVTSHADRLAQVIVASKTPQVARLLAEEAIAKLSSAIELE